MQYLHCQIKRPSAGSYPASSRSRPSQSLQRKVPLAAIRLSCGAVEEWERLGEADGAEGNGTHSGYHILLPLPDPPSSSSISELAGWYQTMVVETVARTYSQDESGSYMYPLPDPSGLRYRGSTHGTLGHNS